MVTTEEMSAAKRPPQILDLNDDCLALIVKRLNIVEQFQISKLHTRFKNIIQSQWRTKLNHVILNPEILNDIDDKTFIDFMLVMSTYMQSLQMKHCDIRFFRLLHDQIFQSTQTFIWVGIKTNVNSSIGEEAEEEQTWEVEGEEEEENEDEEVLDKCRNTGGEDQQFMDEDVIMLVQIFPNLKVLKLKCCQITGKYLSQLLSLRQLSLDDCQYLDSDNFPDVFQYLKLRKFDIMEDCDEINCCDLVEFLKCCTLEHMKIADYHLCFDHDVVDDILRMPKLKKLSIYSKNFVFDVLERISRSSLKQIEAFKFNGILHNFGRFFEEFTHMKELKKLSFYGCHGDDIEGIRDHMLIQISQQLANLEEIHLCLCDLESENGVISFLENCRQLRLINLTSTRKCFDASAVYRCMELLKKQKWRTSPVELWLRDTDVDKSILEDPRYMYNDRFLKLDFKSFIVDLNPPGVLKFTFTT